MVHFTLKIYKDDNINNYITAYPINGDNIVTRPKFEPDSKGNTGKIWINKTQYFDGISQTIWDFFIGGYQPLQKWLKDHNGRTLTYEDITYFQKIVVALNETNRIMKDISEGNYN